MEFALLLAIYRSITQLRKGVRYTVAQLDDLKAAVGAVADDVRRVSDDVKAVIAKLGQPGVDMQAQIDALKSVDTDLQSAAATMETAVTPTPPPVP